MLTFDAYERLGGLEGAHPVQIGEGIRLPTAPPAAQKAHLAPLQAAAQIADGLFHQEDHVVKGGPVAPQVVAREAAPLAAAGQIARPGAARQEQTDLQFPSAPDDSRSSSR